VVCLALYRCHRWTLETAAVAAFITAIAALIIIQLSALVLG
jgi:hypothetical protein